MRFTFFAGLLLTGMLFGARPAHAQTDTVQTRLWQVKISPQHLFIYAINLEAERLLKPSGFHSVTVSPRLYAGKTQTIDKLSTREAERENSTVKGFGIEMMHKIYRKDPLVKNGRQYYAYGLNYHHFNLAYETLGWAEVETEDGLKYFLYQWHQGEEKINRWGLVAITGVQNSFFSPRLIADFYGGLGYRFSKSSLPESSSFNANILDYGSTGLYLTAGLKLGYSF